MEIINSSAACATCGHSGLPRLCRFRGGSRAQDRAARAVRTLPHPRVCLRARGFRAACCMDPRAALCMPPRHQPPPACRPGPGVSVLHPADSELLWGARCGLWEALRSGGASQVMAAVPQVSRAHRAPPTLPGGAQQLLGRGLGGAPRKSGESSPHPTRLCGWVIGARLLPPSSTLSSATPDPGPLPSKHLEAPSTLSASWVRGDTGVIPATPQHTWSLARDRGLWTGTLPGSRPLGLRPHGWNWIGPVAVPAVTGGN